MVGIIARKEIRELLREGRLRLMGAVALLLLVAACFVAAARQSALAAEQHEASQATRRHWLDQGEKDPHSAAHYGMYAFRPAPALAAIDPGLDAYVGRSIFLEAHWQNEFKHRPAQDATALQRFGDLTPAMVLQTLVPLLIIIASFGAVARERDADTLRHVLATGVRPLHLLLGKALGVGLVLAALIAPAVIVGLTAADLTGEAARTRALLLGGAYALYLSTWLCLSLAVSAVSQSAREALAVLLAIWVAGVVIAPRVVGDTASALAPTPSSSEFWAKVQMDIDRGLDGHNPADQRLEALKQQLMRQYGVSSIDQLPVNFSGIALQAGEEHGNRIFDRHFGAVWELFARQHRLQQFASIIAPSLAIRSVSMALAGTDFAHHRRFAAAAERYRRLLNKAMNDDLAYRAKPGQQGHLGGRHLWESVPDFTYRIPDAAWALDDVGPAAVILIAWAAAALAAMLLGARWIVAS